MSFAVHLANRAGKGLRGLPAADRERIFKALEEMEADPLAGDVVKLKGTDTFRRRVGNYRIVFGIDEIEGAVLVMDILRRSTTTYR
ncbi:MAG: type II toxin-antitoxin system RelE/ParE family toxin [Alphaproteobacteria bacterium]|nr:type II toxin-antitoxin system RelE/ParE family toxin [Alphaproteobacteria bacterium]